MPTDWPQRPGVYLALSKAWRQTHVRRDLFMTMHAALLELSDVDAPPGATPPAEITAQAQGRALDSLQRSKRRGLAKAEALARRALQCLEANNHRDAVRFALKATDADADNIVALIVCAVALDRMGQLAQALAVYERALALEPANPDLAALLGDTARRIGEADLSEKFYRAAVMLAPDNPAYANNLAGALRENGRYEDAVELLRSHLYVHPEAHDLWNTLGTVLQESGQPDQALTFLEEALRLRPTFARAHHNLANALADLGQWQRSVTTLDAALALAPPHADAVEMRHARGFALFAVGRIAEAWQDWRARFDQGVHQPTRFVAAWPQWAGDDIAGKRVLVMGEQGLGDEVMFMNAMPDLINAVGDAGKVVIACEPRLASLVARSFPSAEVLPHATKKTQGVVLRGLAKPVERDAFDVWTPMGEVAAGFRQRIEDFPKRPAYLVADPDKTQAWRRRLSALGPGPKIGVMWKSLVMSAKRQRAFAPFAHWRDVLATPGCTFVSLQYGDASAEREIAREQFGVELQVFDDLDLKDDLEGVAALCAALDLVIGPPNATSNIAAACGAPVWMVQHAQAWPMLGTQAMPWYPSVRVFAGARIGHWKELYAEIATALRARITQASNVTAV